MVFIAHLSDLHVGSMSFREELILDAIDKINEMGPDATVVTGDLSDNGYYQAYVNRLYCRKTEIFPAQYAQGLSCGASEKRDLGGQCLPNFRGSWIRSDPRQLPG